jgi:hypothetical protein
MPRVGFELTTPLSSGHCGRQIDIIVKIMTMFIRRYGNILRIKRMSMYVTKTSVEV